MQSKGVIRGIYYCIILTLLACDILCFLWLGLNVLTATGGVPLLMASFDEQAFVYVGIALIACLILQFLFACLDVDVFVGILLTIISVALIAFGAYTWPIDQSAFTICGVPTVLFFLLTTNVLKKGR
ncbi:hypothetical protein [Periweissella fabalis]|uniref:Uncharacterized protein n=1 Tax=Periweissella fabalis TaxID=1070421 RepID=A0A7X6N121_9LACO|nr:hypothetical protein [Periweissella fabalis]MCM0599009.1 hypothetical protein [Periweissella fabalis]NKZ23289.1 hypothetical protein [Periweissella fabalis]